MGMGHVNRIRSLKLTRSLVQLRMDQIKQRQEEINDLLSDTSLFPIELVIQEDDLARGWYDFICRDLLPGDIVVLDKWSHECNNMMGRIICVGQTRAEHLMMSTVDVIRLMEKRSHEQK